MFYIFGGTDILIPWTPKTKALCGPIGDWNLAALLWKPWFSFPLNIYAGVYGSKATTWSCLKEPPLHSSRQSGHAPIRHEGWQARPLVWGIEFADALLPRLYWIISSEAVFATQYPHIRFSSFNSPTISVLNLFSRKKNKKKTNLLNQMFREDCNPFSSIGREAPGLWWNSMTYLEPSSPSLIPPTLSSPPLFPTPSLSAATIQLDQMISPRGAHHSITQPNKKSEKTPMARRVVIFWESQSRG